MDGALRELARAQGGVFSAAQAAGIGVGATQLRRLVGAGQLWRPRHGAYVLRDLAASSSPTERFRLAVLAVCAARPGGAASHHAGLAVHGAPLLGVDLSRIDLVSAVAHVTTRSGVRTHPRPRGTRLVDLDGAPVCDLETCLIQTTAASGLLAGLVAIDWALFAGRVSFDDLRAAGDRISGRRGAGLVRAALGLADQRCESPGETRLRMILHAAHLPWESQRVISDADGAVLARVDFVVGECVVVEFDGAMKYAGAAGRDALVREKVREDALRELGFEVVRITWADLDHPERIIARIRRAVARAERHGGRAVPA